MLAIQKVLEQRKEEDFKLHEKKLRGIVRSMSTEKLIDYLIKASENKYSNSPNIIQQAREQKVFIAKEELLFRVNKKQPTK